MQRCLFFNLVSVCYRPNKIEMARVRQRWIEIIGHRRVRSKVGANAIAVS